MVSDDLMRELELHVATFDDLLEGYSDARAELAEDDPTATDIDRDSVKLKERQSYWAGVLETARKEQAEIS